MTDTIETNAPSVYERFMELSTKEMRSALKSGTRQAMASIRKSARANLRAKVSNASKVNPRFNDTLLSGVRSGRVKEAKDGEITGSVLITSTNKPGSGSFRLKIIEKGTFKTGARYAKTWKGRPLKKPRFTGSLSATNFFAKTRDEKESYYYGEMQRGIEKAIDRINKAK